MTTFNQVKIEPATGGYIVEVAEEKDEEYEEKKHVFTSWRQVIAFMRKLDNINE
jgi:hypothetical protein